MGHYSTECPERKTEEAGKPNSLEKGHVNQVHVGRAFNKPSMVNVTLLTTYLNHLFFIYNIRGLRMLSHGSASNHNLYPRWRIRVLEYQQKFLLRVVAHLVA